MRTYSFYEPRVVIGSHDHACFKAQRCIRKRLYDHAVRMNASRDRLRKDVSSRSRRVRPLHCVRKSVDFGTASDCSLRGLKQCVFGVGESGCNRGFWYSPLWSARYTRLTSTFADFSVNGFTHLRLLRETPF